MQYNIPKFLFNLILADCQSTLLQGDSFLLFLPLQFLGHYRGGPVLDGGIQLGDLDAQALVDFFWKADVDHPAIAFVVVLLRHSLFHAEPRISDFG